LTTSNFHEETLEEVDNISDVKLDIETESHEANAREAIVAALGAWSILLASPG